MRQIELDPYFFTNHTVKDIRNLLDISARLGRRTRIDRTVFTPTLEQLTELFERMDVQIQGAYEQNQRRTSYFPFGFAKIQHEPKTSTMCVKLHDNSNLCVLTLRIRYYCL